MQPVGFVTFVYFMYLSNSPKKQKIILFSWCMFMQSWLQKVLCFKEQEFKKLLSNKVQAENWVTTSQAQNVQKCLSPRKEWYHLVSRLQCSTWISLMCRLCNPAKFIWRKWLRNNTKVPKQAKMAKRQGGFFKRHQPQEQKQVESVQQ